MNIPNLWDAIQAGNARAVADHLHPSSQRDPGPQQPMCRYPDLVEGPSPHEDRGTAVVFDPNYCSKCTPKGYGCCRCDIACNE